MKVCFTPCSKVLLALGLLSALRAEGQTFRPPYTAQYAARPFSSTLGGVNDWANASNGQLSVSSWANTAQVNNDSWAHVGQNVTILPTTTRIDVIASPRANYFAEAATILPFSGYARAILNTQVVMWNQVGKEVSHSVNTIYDSQPIVAFYYSSGHVTAPIRFYGTASRAATFVPETWHVALALAGRASAAGGTTYADAYATTTVDVTTVRQYNSAGLQISP